MGPDGQRGSAPGVLEAGAFFAEVLMLVALVYVGVALPTAVVARVVLAILLPLGVAAIWGRWLAPRATRRLPIWPGLALKVALFAATAVLLGLAGQIVLALAFFVVTEGVVVAAELGRRSR
jgi:hypothetical protein